MCKISSAFLYILAFSHQKHSDRSPGEESCQDVSPVVTVLSHPDHAHQHGQTEQGEADGGLGEPRAFGLKHQRHIHLHSGEQPTREATLHSVSFKKNRK